MWREYNNNKQGVYMWKSNLGRCALRIKYGIKYKII